MAQFTYTKVTTTINKKDYDTWLTAQTAAANTKIIFYQEGQAVENDEIRVKIILELETS